MMNALAQTDQPIASSERTDSYPNGYPLKDWPYTLFFNGEAMPRYSQLWHPIAWQLHAQWTSEDDEPIGRREVMDVIWALESLGLVKSCAPALFVFGIQELLLFAFQRAEELRTALHKNLGLAPDTEAVFQALIEGGFRMRESALSQGRAYLSVGYAESDLANLRREMDEATDLPAGYRLPPHQEHRRFWLKHQLKHQTTLFHSLAQSGTLPKELRRRLHNVRVPDENFLRLIL